MRLLVTGLWPTVDAPSAGTFVRDRVGDDPAIRVIAPTTYRGPMLLRYLLLTLRALSARGPFDVVEAHPLFPAGLVGLLAARLRRIPLVVYAHGADVRETALENPLYQGLARLVVRGAAAVATNSPDTAALVSRLGRTAIVIPPGVDLGRFRPTARPSEHRVLYLGGSMPHKGPEIAHKLADTLAGPGIRVIDPADIPAEIAEHDVVLVPSRLEPFGLVAAEAIASGRWVVAASVGGLRDVVIEGLNGTLVGDGDYAGALARVPDYDPEEVAATAARFDLTEHRRRMDALPWSDPCA